MISDAIINLKDVSRFHSPMPQLLTNNLFSARVPGTIDPLKTRYFDSFDASLFTISNTPTSRSALKKYVTANNKKIAEGKMFDSLFNRALKAGVDKGVFEQPKGTLLPHTHTLPSLTQLIGASGGTKLAKKIPKVAAPKTEKTETKKAEAKPAAAKATTKKPAAKKATATKKTAAKPKAAPAAKKAAPKKTAVKAKAVEKPKAAPKVKKVAAPKSVRSLLHSVLMFGADISQYRPPPLSRSPPFSTRPSLVALPKPPAHLPPRRPPQRRPPNRRPRKPHPRRPLPLRRPHPRRLEFLSLFL